MQEQKFEPISGKLPSANRVRYGVGLLPVEVDYKGIRDVCHEYLFEKVGFVEPINVKWKAKNG